MNRTERNKLVVDNLPLVGYLVSETCAKATHLSRDDLASAGSVALIMSADSFNPDLGVPFGAYARRRIIGAFADEMRSMDWATRTARRRIKETLAVKETLTAALGRTPKVDEIASALGVESSVANDALADASRTVSSLDESTTDFLATSLPSPEGSLLAAERVKYLQAAVAALPEKMRYIVEEIYFHDRSVKELAAELGATHSAVSQQRAEAVRLLRDGLGAHYADDDAVPAVSSRIAPARRAAYLSTMADRTLGGITREHFPAATPLANPGRIPA
ncbi:sigma-70 family RNA polymerase sigma factor [Arthrobacter sp. zg-ZUI100]|uniref:sigma-70 family RNA polymerase sigma factor n=1 Tax=Arthrobacter jiangjiafuii TaxID=2817475 RepID=UPI001AEDF8C1|nr:sigma-70 family RNA polymerase sigma factor [Arthrobacter jiangjiafuii]MBP3037675.1 sigma-70 family RNA polymerase sigma factor [Arthrobacter jiangjiafuii]